MKRIGIVGMMFCMLALFSCQQRLQVPEMEVIMPADSIDLEIGHHKSMQVYDDKLFVIDTQTIDGAVQVYDLNTLQFLFSFGYGKQNLNENYGTNSVSHIDFYEVNGEERVDLIVFNEKIITYSYDAVMREKYAAKPLMERIVHGKFPHILQVIKVSNGYISTGIRTEGKFLLLTDSLEEVKYAGSYRPKVDKFVSDTVHIMANYGEVRVSPDRKYLADCVTIAPVLTLYELTDGDMRKRWEYLKEEIDYEPIEDFAFVPKSKSGYGSTTFSEKYLYALYIGEPDEDEVGHYRREVHVFDIETGELVKQYLLSRPSLDVLWNDGKMYALTYDINPVVQVYNLEE
ncbi:MAG: hypothetical protein J6U14_06185 [Bacteroidaceae bacterium]|nr:hypothetical protein [Bacteroidaceae bacterium]